MDFLSLAQSRFSVRKFKNTLVEEEKLRKVLEAGRISPSAANFQPWHFIVINDSNKLEQLCMTYKSGWIKQAPLIIVACADHSQSWKRGSDGKDSADIDIAIAVDHMTLMANSLGLGSCWVCNFDVNKCAQTLKLPHFIKPTVILPLGYPDTEAPLKKRKPLSDIIHLNTFGNPFS